MVAGSEWGQRWRTVLLVVFIVGMWLLYFFVAAQPAAAPFVYADF